MQGINPYTAMLWQEASGHIAVLVHGVGLDEHLVALACWAAKRAKRKVILIYVIAIPRTLPLTSIVTRETELANTSLNRALYIAQKIGCDAATEIIHARNVGIAIVEEVRDHQCALLLIGWTRQGAGRNCNLGAILPYVQAQAPCQVWVVVDPPSQYKPLRA